MALQLTDLQKVALSIKATNAAGNVMPVSDAMWSVSDDTILTVVADDTGVNASVITTGKIGKATVLAECLSGDVSLKATLDIDVVASPAVALEMIVGDITDK